MVKSSKIVTLLCKIYKTAAAMEADGYTFSLQRHNLGATIQYNYRFTFQ